MPSMGRNRLRPTALKLFNMLKIDMHSHIIPKNLPDWEKKFGYEGFIRLEHHKPSWANMMQGDNFFREINHNCWDPEVRINEYEKYATQVQVVCTIPCSYLHIFQNQKMV
jgi:aminocarboxymuconate-semialdehyde decarboxylase